MPPQANLVLLSPWDLGTAAALVGLVACLSYVLRLGTTNRLLVAALRASIQLLLVGLILKVLFAHVSLLWVSLVALVMLAVASREVWARQSRPLRGWWGLGISSFTLFVSSFAVTIMALHLIITPAPWYEPRYAIPLLGMLLGNTMTGIALSLDRLTQAAWEQRGVIEGRLMIGHTWDVAIAALRRESVRSGMIPTINGMAAAGVVSLPGMMTGQILAGVAPVEAVKYQLAILLLITAGTVFGTVATVWLASRRLFDDRQRLRLDRLGSRDA